MDDTGGVLWGGADRHVPLEDAAGLGRRRGLVRRVRPRHRPGGTRSRRPPAPRRATTEEEVVDGCDARLRLHLDLRAPAARRAGRRRAAGTCSARSRSSTDLAGAAAMADLLRGSGLVHQVGLVLRRSPAFLLLKDLVADPASGRVMSVVFRDDQYIPVQGMYASSWRGDKDEGRLGHAARALDPRPRHPRAHLSGRWPSVSARSANFHGHRRHRGLGGDDGRVRAAAASAR